MKPRTRWLIRIVLAVLALGIFILLGWKYRDDLPKLRHADPFIIACMVGVFLPTRFFTSEIMRIGLRALGHVVSAYETLMVTIVNAYANLLVPRAGLGLPAVYMKLRHKITIADFSTVQLLPMTVIQIMTIGLTGVACVAILQLVYHEPIRWPLYALFGGVTVASYLGTHVQVAIPDRWTGRIAAFLRRLNESWRRLARSGHTIGWSILLNAVVLALRAFRLQLAFWALGFEINYFGAFAASLLADLAFFIALTPAALGYREGAIMLGAALTHSRPEDAFLAALLDRVVTTAVILVVAQVGLWQFVRPTMRQASHLATQTPE